MIYLNKKKMGGGSGEGGGGGWGGLTNERPRTDHVITGPMRDLNKNCMGRGQTNKRQHTVQRAELVKKEKKQEWIKSGWVNFASLGGCI